MTDNRFKVLVTDEVDPEGIAILRAEPSIEVVESPTLPAQQLLEEIPQYDALIGRSATKVSRELLEAGTRLKVIGRAGVGVDNVDLEKATELGIAVINAPGGNVVAVAELFFGVAVSIFRHVHVADELMRKGEWPRSRLGGIELRGRTLGVIGLGRIGGEVARRAKAFGMRVIAYDPYVAVSRFEEVGVERAESLHAALDVSDVVTVHTPLTQETRGLIGAPELARLKRDAVVLNLARGGIVDEEALVDALENGRLAGAGLDVYAKEPRAPDHPLRTLPNVLLTPHLGASTEEAQVNVAIDVAEQIVDCLAQRPVRYAVNAPIIILPNIFEPELCQKLIGLYEEHGGTESGFLNPTAFIIFNVVFFGLCIWLSARLRKHSFAQDDDGLVEQERRRFRLAPSCCPEYFLS